MKIENDWKFGTLIQIVLTLLVFGYSVCPQNITDASSCKFSWQIYDWEKDFFPEFETHVSAF